MHNLTNKQLERLYNRLVNRINRAFVGGRQYGIDLPTLRAVCPGLYNDYLRLRAEWQQRQ